MLQLAWLSGLAWMRAPADGVLGTPLRHHPNRHDRGHADNKSYPSEVAHPGLVLGDYARHEFGGVDAAIKRSQYSEGRAAPQRSTSLVVSGRDQSLSVFEDDQLVAQGKVVIRDAHKPIGETEWSR